MNIVARFYNLTHLVSQDVGFAPYNLACVQDTHSLDGPHDLGRIQNRNQNPRIHSLTMKSAVAGGSRVQVVGANFVADVEKASAAAMRDPLQASGLKLVEVH